MWDADEYQGLQDEFQLEGTCRVCVERMFGKDNRVVADTTGKLNKDRQ